MFCARIFCCGFPRVLVWIFPRVLFGFSVFLGFPSFFFIGPPGNY